MQIFRRVVLLTCLLVIVMFLNAQPRILTNQVGYEVSLSKKAVVMADTRLDLASFQLIDTHTGQPVYQGTPVFSGPVS
ncbi:MAG TPA: cellulase N-terminal Ig-like domain-containing protein, partial [Puia sp.]